MNIIINIFAIMFQIFMIGLGIAFTYMMFGDMIRESKWLKKKGSGECPGPY